MTGKTWALAILLILPSLFLYVGNNFNNAKYAGDPDYIYLMNAINLARGKDAGHIDNPGTPVMEIGSGLLYLHHMIQPTDGQTLQEAVLSNPDMYVELIRKLLLLLSTLALLFAGWFFYLRSENIWLALVIQFTPFLSVNVLERSWTTVAPEPLLLFVTTIYVVLLAWYYFDQSKPWIRYLVLFSIFGGLGLATKATFLPLLVIPFFLLRDWRHRLIYFSGTVASFFFFTLPAHKQYRGMFRWFEGLITHKGIYGSGEKGLIDPVEYGNSIIQIFGNNLFFTSLLIISITVLILHFAKNRKTPPYSARRLLMALVVTQLLAILIVAKHYHKNHYLLPELALSGIVFFFAVESLDELYGIKKWKKILPAGFLTLSIIVFTFVFIPELSVKNKGYAETNREFFEVQSLTDRDFSDQMRIYHYPDGLNKLSALKFGNGYSKLLNRFALDTLYPKAYFFNVMTRNFQHWETPVPVEDLVRKYGKKMIITGRPLSPDGMQLLNDYGLYVEPAWIGKFQAVYKVDSLSPALKQLAAR